MIQKNWAERRVEIYKKGCKSLFGDDRGGIEKVVWKSLSIL